MTMLASQFAQIVPNLFESRELCSLPGITATLYPWRVTTRWYLRNVGVAGTGIIAGALIDLSGWRAAFIVPGMISVATGLVMLGYLRSGALVDDVEPSGDADAAAGRDGGRAFMLLVITMVTGALVYHSAQVALPKLFALRLESLVGESAFGVLELMGNGWEWTSTSFAPRKGYAQHLEGLDEFADGERFVVLGGSWATSRRLLRRSFRLGLAAHDGFHFAKFRGVTEVERGG